MNRVIRIITGIAGIVIALTSMVVIIYLADQQRPSLIPWFLLMWGAFMTYAAVEDEERANDVDEDENEAIHREWSHH